MHQRRRRGWFARSAVALLASVTVWFTFGASRPVAAHAVLTATSPADQSVLSSPPERVSVTFDEAVSYTPAAIRVYDASGGRADTGDVRRGDTDRSVTVGLRSDLPDGSYVVAWKVVSADSHPIHGGFVFSIGAPTSVEGLDGLIAAGDDPGWTVIGHALRGLGMAWAFFVVGGALFAAFVGDRLDRRRGVRVGLAVGAAMTTLFTLAQLPQSAALATGLGAGSLFDAGVAAQVLGAGVRTTMIGLVVGVVLGAASVWIDGARARRACALVAAVLVAGALAASGHSRTRDPVALTTLVVVAHAAAALVWAGLVLHASWSLRTRSPGTAAAAASAAGSMVVRLSRAATVAVGVVAVTGVVLALQEVGSLEGLTDTTYGRLVLAKVVLVAGVALAAAVNHFRIVPLIRRGGAPRAAWRILRRLVAIECVGLLAVVGVTGVLVSVIPARTVIDSSKIVSESVPLGDGSLNLVLDPATTGRTSMHVYLLDDQGRVDDDASSVVVRSSFATPPIGPITRTARRVGPGHYQLDGTLFTVPGTWLLEVDVRVDEFTLHTAELTIPVR